ncbi:MAG TPA: class I SAM-dependent RNA methyltransferase [Gemmatimonadaceae bacterium]|nr:class I SAM-dependent RNA methyltransferase [Gemmatimonadaceae bacterium]
MPQMVSVEIESIAAGGDGVGRSNGLVIFVPRTAPGELVTARISGKGSFARGALRSIARLSEERIEPPCPHYTRDKCGGCQIQHITYAAQLRGKKRIIRDAMERIGKRKVEVSDVRPSPDEWRYRSKLTLAMQRLSSGEWIAGLHQYDNPARIFALMDCPITQTRIVGVWREILKEARFFPPSQSLRGSVRLSGDGPVFVMIGGSRWPNGVDFFDHVKSLAAVWWEHEDGGRRLIGDRRPPRSLQPPVASFAQINNQVAANLTKHVVATVSAHCPETLVDAYAGAGDTAIAFARKGIRVTAIELDGDAARWCALRLPEGSVSVRARVEQALPGVLPSDAVVLNPPRGGLDQAVTRTLESTLEKPRVVLYVSCNPATLARDVARLPGYRISSIVPFDMFPQTAHVETVCELVPDSA